MRYVGQKNDGDQCGGSFEMVHQQWVATLDAIRDAICVVDQSQRLVRANAAFAALAQRDYPDLIGCSLAAVLPWLVQENGHPAVNQAMSPDGRLFRVRLSSTQDALQGSILIAEDVSDQVALQAAEAKYNEGTARSRIEAIGALLCALDVSDPYTARHSRNVAMLARRMAVEMGRSEFEAQGVYYGACVHDIGKFAIPDGILSRPGRLSEAELNLIHTHCESGHAIVKDMEFPWPVHEIVLQHHERMDGSGYPYGLKADQIHWAARIVAVADVVEAMSAHRPYRPSLGMDAAQDEIRSGAGKKYDAAAVAACTDLIEAGSELSAASAGDNLWS